MINKHDFLAEELMMPNADKTDSNRGYMFCQHLPQSVNLKHPEFPLIFTNFENQFGEYSDMGFLKAERDFKIIAKIEKNVNVYYLIIQYIDNGEYHVIERREEIWLTEKYGFTMNNNVIDSIEVGDIVEKDTNLYKSYNYDENDNFSYGTNLKTIFFTEKLKTLEDAIVISKTGAEKLKTYNVEKVKVVLNENDLLLNMDNENKGYRTFPAINEYSDGFLCIRRRINNKKLYSFDNLSGNNIKAGDECFYAKGKVVDIDIFSNIETDELKGVYNKQILKSVKDRNNFNKKFYNATKDFMEKENTLYSNDLLQMYNNIKMELSGLKFSYENSTFSGIVIIFTILKELPLNIGSKITGRYGNKGVCSTILEDGTEEDLGIVVLDDDKMPRIEEGPFKGEIPDICLNPLGIYNRLNPSQLFEHELNFISKHIRYKIATSRTLQQKEKWYFEFLDKVAPIQSKSQRKIYEEFSNDEKKEFMKECEECIYIHQAPFYGNTDIDQLRELYEKYDFAKPFKFTGINIPLIMGEMYFMRLKHEPSGKLSARSTSFENLKNLPSKSKAFSDKKAHHSDTPIRIGNQEVINLLLTRNPEAVKFLMDSYSNNEISKRRLLEALIDSDPYDINVDRTQNEPTETEKMIQTLLYNMALEVVDC